MNYDKMCMIPGYAYIPLQRLQNVYDPDKALNSGTLFPCLDIPMNEYGKKDLSECESFFDEEVCN